MGSPSEMTPFRYPGLSEGAGVTSEVDSRKTEALATVIERLYGRPSRLLVVGCGSGQEAGILAARLGAQVIGVDVTDYQFDTATAFPATLKVMDAHQLEFEDDSFDFVYSFHCLEHIADKDAALAEMRRVLRPGGGYVIGTPNKTRLVGYLNSSEGIGDRLWWNLRDYGRRLTGRWANEKGAHAGFAGPELLTLCREAFGSSEEISDEYYSLCYPGSRRLLGSLRRTGLHRILYPCVYVTGRFQTPE